MRGFEFLIVLTIAMLICGFCFDYNLTVYFGKDIPWYCDCLAGFLIASINVPAAVIGFVLECSGTTTPIFTG